MKTAAATDLPADWQGYFDDFTLSKGRALSPRTLHGLHF